MWRAVPNTVPLALDDGWRRCGELKGVAGIHVESCCCADAELAVPSWALLQFQQISPSPRAPAPTTFLLFGEPARRRVVDCQPRHAPSPLLSPPPPSLWPPSHPHSTNITNHHHQPSSPPSPSLPAHRSTPSTCSWSAEHASYRPSTDPPSPVLPPPPAPPAQPLARVSSSITTTALQPSPHRPPSRRSRRSRRRRRRSHPPSPPPSHPPPLLILSRHAGPLRSYASP